MRCDLKHECEPDSAALQGITRRRFLGLAPVAVASLTLASGTEASEGELAQAHALDPAVLIDLTRCVGCGRCVDACKADNGLDVRDDQPAIGPEAQLASSNYTVVKALEVDGETVTVKRQCMHCLEPACASVCFVKALTKSEAGPVVYDPNRCIGCRYCIMACPFGIPTFDWEARFGRVNKCDLCVDRTSQGMPTACAEACPGGALTFGRREDMLMEAHRRLDSDSRYVKHIYGETEVGGTSILYVSDVPFEKLGMRAGLPDEPLPGYTWEITRLIPPAAAGIGAALVTLYLRRVRVLEEERAAKAAISEPESLLGEGDS